MRLSTASAAASQRRAISMQLSTSRILGGMAGDGAGRLHGALHRFARQVRGAGIAAALAEVDRDAQALVAVVLDGLHLAAPHGDRLAHGGGDFDFGVAGAAGARHLDRMGSHVGHGIAAEGKGRGGYG
jgi:hypothetical protein